MTDHPGKAALAGIVEALDASCARHKAEIERLQKECDRLSEKASSCSARAAEADIQSANIKEAALELADIAEKNTDDCEAWDAAIEKVRSAARSWQPQEGIEK